VAAAGRRDLANALRENAAVYARAPGRGHKLLIQSGRLRRSINYEVDGHTVRIGTDVIYGRIHQLGGMAGRGRKVHIPARPYLVFRPEDPDRIAKAMELTLTTRSGGRD
jgi:phage virion morphogenesis protein